MERSNDHRNGIGARTLGSGPKDPVILGRRSIDGEAGGNDPVEYHCPLRRWR